MRTIGRQFYHDRRRKRFVVYRTKGQRVFKTSVRYGAVRTLTAARQIAEEKASLVIQNDKLGCSQ